MRRRTLGSMDSPPKPVTEGEKEVRDLFHKMTALTIFGKRTEDELSASELFANFADPKLARISELDRELQDTPVLDLSESVRLIDKIAEYRRELQDLKSLDLSPSTSESIKDKILKILTDGKEIRALIEKEKSENSVLELQATDRIVEPNIKPEAVTVGPENVFSSVAEIDHEIDGFASGPRNTRYETEFDGRFADAKENEVQEMLAKLPTATLESIHRAETPELKAVVAKIQELNAYFKDYRDTDPAQQNVVDVVHQKRKTYLKLFTELQTLITRLEGDTETSGEPLQSQEVVMEQSDTEKLSQRNQEREAKAQAFAEKFGIADERQRMLEAEAAYLEAQTALHSKAWTLGKKIPQEIQDEYDKSRLYWRHALGAATLMLREDDPEAKRNKVMAKFIGLRDTVLRAEEVRIQAREAGLSERDKTLFGKIQNSVEGFAGATARTYNKGFDIAGTVLAKTERKIFGNADLDLEKRGAQYARASRILGGAVLGTLLTTGTAGLASMPLLFRVARGAVGVLGGSAAGAAAGSVYKKFFASKNQSELLASIKNLSTPIELSEMFTEQDLYRKGNAQARAERQKKWETAAAIVAGGATSLGSGYALQHAFGDLPSVKAASISVNESQSSVPVENTTSANPKATLAETKARLNSSVAEISKIQEQAGRSSASPEQTPGNVSDVARSAPPVANVTPETSAPTIPEIASTPVEATISEGEGALKMFADLKSNLRAQYPEGTDMPENVKLILDRDPQVLAKTLGFMHTDGSSRIMHVGDSIKVDSHGAVIFADHNPKIEPVSLISHAGKLETTEVGGRFETQTTARVETAPAPLQTSESVAPASEPRDVGRPTTTTAQLNAEQLAKIEGNTPNADSLAKTPISLNSEPLQTNVDTITAQEVSTANVEQNISTTEPFFNKAGVRIYPESHIYEHSSHRSVIWSGEGDFQKDLDLAKSHLEKLVAEGKHGSVLVETERINPFTNASEITMYEFSTEADGVAVYSSGDLPIKPYGPNDFVNPKQ